MSRFFTLLAILLFAVFVFVNEEFLIPEIKEILEDLLEIVVGVFLSDIREHHLKVFLKLSSKTEEMLRIYTYKHTQQS